MTIKGLTPYNIIKVPLSVKGFYCRKRKREIKKGHLFINCRSTERGARSGKFAFFLNISLFFTGWIANKKALRAGCGNFADFWLTVGRLIFCFMS